MPPNAKAKVGNVVDWIVKAIVSIACTIFCAFAIGSFNWAREIHTTVVRIEARFDAAKAELDNQRAQLIDIVSRLTRLEEARRDSDKFRPTATRP